MTESHDHSLIVDWSSGRLSTPLPPSTLGDDRAVTIVVGGDWAPDLQQQRALMADAPSFYRDVAPLFRSAHLSIVNLEMPACQNRIPTVKDGPNLALDPQIVAAGLRSLGCTTACLANNHIMDYGPSGLLETLDVLRAHQIEPVGAGRNRAEAGRPSVVHIRGHKIAMVNAAEGEEARSSDHIAGAAPLDIAGLCRQVSALAGSSHTVILILHAGREYVPIPPPYLRDAYRALANAGASIVIGHHPHVPQGMEIWKGVPIFYSLGNFVSRPTGANRYRNLGYLLTITLKQRALATVEIEPYEIGETGLILLSASSRETFLAELERISGHIASPFAEQFWAAYADAWWEARLPEEIKLFATLLSWQGWMEATVHRLSMSIAQSHGLTKLVLRLARRALRWLSRHGSPRRAAAPRAAAVLRNRFDTPAHAYVYKEALQRVIDGTVGGAQPWARGLLEEWKVLA